MIKNIYVPNNYQQNMKKKWNSFRPQKKMRKRERKVVDNINLNDGMDSPPNKKV